MRRKRTRTSRLGIRRGEEEEKCKLLGREMSTLSSYDMLLTNESPIDSTSCLVNVNFVNKNKYIVIEIVLLSQLRGYGRRGR